MCKEALVLQTNAETQPDRLCSGVQASPSLSFTLNSTGLFMDLFLNKLIDCVNAKQTELSAQGEIPWVHLFLPDPERGAFWSWAQHFAHRNFLLPAARDPLSPF